MELPIVKYTKTEDVNEFVNHWSNLYDYKGEARYNSRISNGSFSIEDIEELFHWKNGMKLSRLKSKSLNEKIISKIEVINNCKAEGVEIDMFLEEFKYVSLVWKIFLLHIIAPKKYPIYDQHIHRAYCYINDGGWRSISDRLPNKKKEEFYFNEYLPFVQSLKVSSLKKLDEAFFAFGQFINTRKQYNIFNK